MADVIGSTIALIGGDMAGRALGGSMNKGGAMQNGNQAPTVPTAAGAGGNPLDVEAGTLRQSKRNAQAQDLSLFTLSNSKNLVNNNSLLGL